MLWTPTSGRSAGSIPDWGWGEEFSAGVWDHCQPSIVKNLSSYWFLSNENTEKSIRSDMWKWRTKRKRSANKSSKPDSGWYVMRWERKIKKLCKKILLARPEASRMRGRPRLTWRVEVDEDFRIFGVGNWLRDHDEWRGFLSLWNEL